MWRSIILVDLGNPLGPNLNFPISLVSGLVLSRSVCNHTGGSSSVSDHSDSTTL